MDNSALQMISIHNPGSARIPLIEGDVSEVETSYISQIKKQLGKTGLSVTQKTLQQGSNHLEVNLKQLIGRYSDSGVCLEQGQYRRMMIEIWKYFQTYELTQEDLDNVLAMTPMGNNTLIRLEDLIQIVTRCEDNKHDPLKTKKKKNNKIIKYFKEKIERK